MRAPQAHAHEGMIDAHGRVTGLCRWRTPEGSDSPVSLVANGRLTFARCPARSLVSSVSVPEWAVRLLTGTVFAAP